MDFILSIFNYLSTYIVIAGIYAIFSLGLNIHWGYTGIFNIGISAFFALGAYTAAILTSSSPSPEMFEDFIWGGNLPQNMGIFNLGLDLWYFAGMLGAILICGIAATIIGWITLKLRDDYFAISTLGLAETVRFIFLNEKWLANGSRGMYRIPKFLGDWFHPAYYNYFYGFFILLLIFILYLIVQRAINSPWGRVLKAIREDEIATAAGGKNVFLFKLQSFVLGACIMGIGGVVYAHGIRYLDPLTFDPLMATFIIWAMLMVGGSGNNKGAIIGAFIVWAIWTWTDFLPGFLADPNLKFFMIGLLITLVIVFKPEGIIGEKKIKLSSKTNLESDKKVQTTN